MIYYHIEGCAALKTGKKVIPRDLFKDLEVELSLSNFCFLYVRGCQGKTVWRPRGFLLTVLHENGQMFSRFHYRRVGRGLNTSLYDWLNRGRLSLLGFHLIGRIGRAAMENWDARTTQSTGNMAGDYGKTQLYSHTIVPAHEAGIDAHTHLLFLLPDWLSLSLYWRKYHKGVKKKVTLKLRWSWW